MDRKRVLFVSLDDPDDVTAWSGVPHHMLTAVRELADVDVLVLRRGPLERVAHLIGKALSLLTGKRVELNRSPPLLRSYGRTIERALDGRDHDLVLSPSSVAVAAVRGTVPVVFWTDATFDLLVEEYAQSGTFSPLTLRLAENQERRSLLRAARCGYSSDWAGDRARQHAPGADVRLAEFGPNLDEGSLERARAIRASRSEGEVLIRLLWMGGDWFRKGGDLAVDAVRLLREQGTPVVLDLVGAGPLTPVPIGVTAHGRLSRADPGALAASVELLGRADLLLVPSRADCTPIVVSEAAAVGLPVVATDVGGLGEMVRRHGIGVAIDGPRATGETLASAISEALQQRRTFSAACRGAATELSYRRGLERLLV